MGITHFAGATLVASALCLAAMADEIAARASTNAPAAMRRRGNWKPSPEELAREDEEYNRATGGQLYVEPAGPPICIYDCRETPATNAPSRVTAVLGSMYRFPSTNTVATLALNANPLAEAETWRRRDKVAMAILLTDGGAEEPSLTICPDERVAVVNCRRASQFTKGEDADARFIKEMWRAVGFITGAGFSRNDASVMQPVSSPVELDAVEWQVIHPSAYQNMAKFFRKYGIQRGHWTTYRAAVKEGWAPPPTNDYQRAVWDEEKANANATNAPAAK